MRLGVPALVCICLETFLELGKIFNVELYMHFHLKEKTQIHYVHMPVEYRITLNPVNMFQI
jgi:hypothetical protein